MKELPNVADFSKTCGNHNRPQSYPLDKKITPNYIEWLDAQDMLTIPELGYESLEGDLACLAYHAGYERAVSDMKKTIEFCKLTKDL